MKDPTMLGCMWRHKEKGGLYEAELLVSGAGSLNSEKIIVYSKAIGQYETFALR